MSDVIPKFLKIFYWLSMGSSHRKAYGTQSLRTARTCSAWFIHHDLGPNIFPCHPFHTVHNNIILIYLWSFLCQTVAKDWMHQQKNWTSFTFQHWQCTSHNLMYYLVQRGLFFKDVMNKLQQCLISKATGTQANCYHLVCKVFSYSWTTDAKDHNTINWMG